MLQLLYAMQFRGRATMDDRGNGVVRTTALSPSCTVITLIGPEGAYGVVEPQPGERATFESEVPAHGAGRTLGSATVTFGTTGHCLHLTLLGSLDLDDSPPTTTRSSMTWKFERGEGSFAGATVLFTSNLIVRALGGHRQPVGGHFSRDAVNPEDRMGTSCGTYVSDRRCRPP